MNSEEILQILSPSSYENYGGVHIIWEILGITWIPVPGILCLNQENVENS